MHHVSASGFRWASEFGKANDGYVIPLLSKRIPEGVLQALSHIGTSDARLVSVLTENEMVEPHFAFRMRLLQVVSTSSNFEMRSKYASCRQARKYLTYEDLLRRKVQSVSLIIAW